MCGIAGLIHLDGSPSPPSILMAMNAALRHRGGDDEGYVLIDQSRGNWKSFSGKDSPTVIREAHPFLPREAADIPANIGLAHQRFSIIDLSADGHQPFFSSDGSCCAVFNGEIYNYIELREELARKGCQFRSTSDTEVLVEAYRHWGPECFERLNGFWALAIYDFPRRRLLISRDRLGKKPLYWSKCDDRIYFASEIKALLQVPEIFRSKRLNESASHLWLAHGWRDVGSHTLFEGIYSLPPASWSIVDLHFPDCIRTFWEVPGQRLSEKEVSVPEAAAVVKNTLQDAVQIRLRADVPLSIELSGGMDSSALVAMAAQLHPNKMTTYTVRFKDKQWNEEPFARSVAARHPVDFRVIDAPSQSLWAKILEFTYLQEEPYHSPNLQTNQMVWTLMRSHGTKVSLNGAAGDELFAGYSGYFGPAQLDNIRSGHFDGFLKNLWRWSEERWPGEAAARSLLSVVPISWNGWNHAAVSGIFKHIDPCRSEGTPFRLGTKTLSSVLLSDITRRKIPYWLRSGDKSSMGIPFEVRAPFLDYRLVEHACRLPASYLVRDGWHKWILRKALRGLLPDDVLWRRRKIGFPFPYDRFCRESEPILSLIFCRARNPYLNLFRGSGLRHEWRVISFILWHELFFNQNMPLFSEISEMSRRLFPNSESGHRPEYWESSGTLTSWA